jgi:hypothetical protein
MAREFIRAGLTGAEIGDFLGPRRVLVAPGREEVDAALADMQRRCRTNCLKPADLDAAWNGVTNGRAVARAGDWNCPRHFKYGIDGTVVEILRLVGGMIGVVIGRQRISPGTTSGYWTAAPGLLKRAPEQWLSGVLDAFWMFLSDEEIRELENKAVLQAMENGVRQAERRAHLARERQRKRREQLEALFRGTRPQFVTELAVAVAEITITLSAEGRDSIRWADLKKRWPAVASRHQVDLLELVRDRSVSVDALRSLAGRAAYLLRFSTWNGPQRSFSTSQLVFNINCPTAYARLRNRGEQTKILARWLRDARLRWHPGTATTIGWLRVHIDDDNKLCFVDEVQSDVLEDLRRVPPADAISEFVTSVCDWHIHGFASVKRWAIEIGYRAGIHSRRSAAAKKGMTKSDRKWYSYYAPIIKRFDLHEMEVTGYGAPVCIDVVAQDLLRGSDEVDSH